MISKVNVLDLVKKYELKNAKMSGDDNLVCCCPFHNDTNESFAINIRNGKFICYASNCGKKGDIYRFISLMEGISENQAKKNIFGNNENAQFYSLLNDIDNSLEPPQKEGSFPVKTNLYLSNLLKFTDCQKFLDQLNISFDVAKKVKLKICTGPKFYRGRLAISIGDDVWELRDLTKQAEKKVLYTVGTKVSEILYTGTSDFSKPYCFITEGTKDVLTINSFGYNACCCFGTNLSPSQINIMLRHGIEKVFMLYDGDDAGKSAAKKNYPKLKKYFDVVWLNCPDSKDPNDLTKSEFNKLIGRYVENL